jgi:hypothetical protein
MQYYKTDLGLVVVDSDSIRLKSSYKKVILTETEFNAANPVKINKHKYLAALNLFFKNDKFEWEHNGNAFKKLDNFRCEFNDFANTPFHDIGKSYIGKCMIVLYHGRLYYTFLAGNYYPQMQLVDFHTKELTSKWTNIKNLAPVFNKTTKQII